ncbi:hypothetical protein [Sandaracinus amylolyticus]|uniref:hypothetical protein n=1 Tax=Sandaracinus amylolyticus TaxID=927083 RepID=UPI001F1B9248|nr:hypothetical protein [Sandaracinus amylolyticus]UJR78259.1 Hypothetical protein I5071_2860 [Sandaracinus amylolyticus]
MSPTLLKPPVRVRPGALLRPRDGFALGPRAEEELFRVAEVLTEGRLDRSAFFGSALITIDLEKVAPQLRGPEGEAERRRLFDAVSGSVRVRLRAMRLALADVARRHPDKRLGTATTETRFRLDGSLLLLDVDLEVPVDLSSRARDSVR